MEKTVRFGIMGTGFIAGVFCESIKRVPGAILSAVGSRTYEKAAEFAKTHGAEKAYGSYEELANDPTLDVIYIATPNSCHYECAKICINAKKGVLCEKPFMLNAKEAREIKELAASNGVFLMEALWSSFLPVTAQLAQAVKDGIIGTLRQIYIEFGFICDPDPSKRFLNADLGGGALLDIGVYAVAFLQAITGSAPLDIKSFAKMSSTGVDEHFTAMLRYPGDVTCAVNCSMMSPAPATATLYGSKGQIIVPSFNGADMYKVLIPGCPEEIVYASPRGASFDYEAQETVRCIQKGLTKSEILPPGASVQIAEILDEIRAQWTK